MTLDKTLLGILVGLFSASSASALDPQLDSGGFREEDRAVAEEIAAYSADERHAALIAAGFPEDLLEVQQIQGGSTDDFATLVEGFSREDQEQIWDLVRYPGLVADLARGGAKSDADLERIAQRYPEEIRPGMVFALETQHGKVHEFGVRLEEMLLVNETGHELLSTYKSDEIIVVD